MLWCAFASTFFVGGPLLLFAQADFEKDQEQRSPQAGHYQRNGDHLTGQPTRQCGEQCAGDNQERG